MKLSAAAGHCPLSAAALSTAFISLIAVAVYRSPPKNLEIALWLPTNRSIENI